MDAILENRDEWLAAFRSGWLAHYQATGETDWGQYPRPNNRTAPAGEAVRLSESRLLLITSSGSYLRDGQQPFDADDDLGDYTIRTYPSNTPLEALAFAHGHYDHTAVEQDPQVLVPLGHLQDMAAAGEIGELAPTVISFMGYQPDLTRVVDELIPLIVEAARKDGAHAALLVPA